MSAPVVEKPAKKNASGQSANECPHCHKPFTAKIDTRQPPRLQGAKCPNCKLFVPLDAINGPLSAEERRRRG